MSYLVDVGIAYSKDGWNQLCKHIDTMDEESRLMVKEFINGHHRARVTDQGDRYVGFDSIDESWDGAFNCFMNCHNFIDSNNYLALIIGEDGAEDFHGDYFHNPFGVAVHRMIVIDPAGSYFIGDDMFAFEAPSETFKAEPLKESASSIDDHTCIACNNTKCSKTEKSCWKCGHPI